MATHGVSSFTIDPNGPQIISSQWVQDIVSLGTGATGRLKIRSRITARDSDSEVDVNRYKDAFGRYYSVGCEGYGVLDHGFRPGMNPNEPLTGGLINPYIEDFANRAAHHSYNLKLSGVRGYFVWNEPNNTASPDYLSPDRFAAMMYQTYHRVKPMAGSDFKVYMGGILWAVGAHGPDEATRLVGEYLQNVKNYLNSQGVTSMPWDAVNLHIHHGSFSQTDMDNLKNAVLAVFGYTPPTVVGEWGITAPEAEIGGYMLNTFTLIRNNFSPVFYFLHPQYFQKVRENPDEYVEWGAATWGVNPGTNEYEVTGHRPIWDQLHYLYQWP